MRSTVFWTVASIAGKEGNPNASAYSASKAALTQLARVAAPAFWGWLADRTGAARGIGRATAEIIGREGGVVVAALSVSGPVNRMTSAKVKAIVQNLRPAAQEIGEAL